MSDRKLSLLELHFDGPIQIGPKLFRRPDEETDTSEVAVEDEGVEIGVDVDSGERIPGPTVGKAIVAVGAVAVVALGIRRLLSGADSEESVDATLDEFETDDTETETDTFEYEDPETDSVEDEREGETAEVDGTDGIDA
jgi:hypothetical protein